MFQDISAFRANFSPKGLHLRRARHLQVRRGDLDLKKDKKARELAIADNRVGELDLEWNPEVLATLNVDLKQKVLLISEPDNESGRYSEIILMVVDAVCKVRQIIVGLERSEPQIAVESEIQAASRQDCN
jgi:hypothetical protein